jgi:hypothetical protein
VSTLHYLELLSMARLRIKRDVDYSPAASKRRDAEKACVIANHLRDKHFDCNIIELIPLDCSEHALVHNASKGKAAWFANGCLLTVLDFFLLGWI